MGAATGSSGARWKSMKKKKKNIQKLTYISVERFFFFSFFSSLTCSRKQKRPQVLTELFKFEASGWNGLNAQLESMSVYVGHFLGLKHVLFTLLSAHDTGCFHEREYMSSWTSLQWSCHVFSKDSRLNCVNNPCRGTVNPYGQMNDVDDEAESRGKPRQKED